MGKRINNKSGFTLIELIMVIVILGLLAAVAFPHFTDLTTRGQNAAEQGVLGGIRAGIATQHAGANPPAYPATLDSATNGACTSSNACFGTVLAQGGITGDGWTRVSDTSYTHAGENTSTYTYTPATGQYVCTTNCP